MKSPSLLENRPAGYSVVLECLARQQLAVPRSKLKRILGFPPLHPDAWPWFAGAVGEMQVGRILAKLGEEWTVLHAVPVGEGRTDIDHVVIGPAGLFTINNEAPPRCKGLGFAEGADDRRAEDGPPA